MVASAVTVRGGKGRRRREEKRIPGAAPESVENSQSETNAPPEVEEHRVKNIDNHFPALPRFTPTHVSGPVQLHTC